MDVLSIKDPVEKKSQQELALVTKEIFSETLMVDSDSRYEERLPWLEEHPHLASYYSVVKNRFQGILGKLKCDRLPVTKNVLYLPHLL